MNILGVSGRDRDAAAAVSIEGRLVSAVAEESLARVPGIGYARTGGFPHAAADAALKAAGLEPEDLEQIVVVDDGPTRPTSGVNGRFRGIPVREMAPSRADAVHAAATAPQAALILVAGADSGTLATYQRGPEGLGPRSDIPGADGLLRCARRLAGALQIERASEGGPPDDPFAVLDRLSVGGEPVHQEALTAAVRTTDRGGVEADADRLMEAVTRVAGAYAPALADAGSMNARLIELRRDLAASFIVQLADVVAQEAASAANTTGASTVVAGGALFGNARFNTQLRRLMPAGLAIAFVPEAVGRASGAAASELSRLPPGLALGPAFDEEEIKRTLDNCRLDYVYEPDWTRLMKRASKMLTQGKVVAWFQGSMAFGPRSLGTRSILADPSPRYARQNVNEYLRRVVIDEPTPVALAPSMESACLVRPSTSAGGVVDEEVKPDWRTSLAGALNWRQQVRVHGVASDVEARLRDLLELHYASSGVPGLIQLNLAGPGEPVACTPRDALRTTFSSAIDALVIGRFLLMKDYWLLRTQD
jgi:carbamoyltransferase